VLPTLDMITEGFVMVKGKKYPVLQIDVIASLDSNPTNLEFKWVTSDMTKRSVNFKLQFSSAIYVSSQAEPDILKVTFHDPYIFVGVNDLAISKASSKDRRRLNKDIEEGDFITLER